MKQIITIILILFISFISHAYSVTATEKYNGYYENGRFSNDGKGTYIIKYEVDEKEQIITRTSVIRQKDNSVELDNTRYYITTIDYGGTYLGLAKDKMGQRIITAVGVPGTLATEMIQLGDNFYYWSKAIGGVYYLSYGSLKKHY